MIEIVVSWVVVPGSTWAASASHALYCLPMLRSYTLRLIQRFTRPARRLARMRGLDSETMTLSRT